MRVLFVLKDALWLQRLKKSFNGNYKNHLFDFRRSPRSALGRFIRGLRYDIALIDYGWSVNGLVKEILLRRPLTNVMLYSLMLCQKKDCVSFDIIKKDIGSLSKKLLLHGVLTNDKY